MTVPTLGLPLDRERPLLPQLREARPAELGLAAVASVLVGCAVGATDAWLVFALVGVAFFVALGTLRPALFLGLVILVRPLLDDVSDVTIGAPSANVGGALALALILATAVLAARRRPLIIPAAAPALVLAIAVSAVSALHAWQVFGSTVGTDAVGEVLRVGALLAAFVLAANSFGTPERVRRLFVLVALCGVVPAITGLVEWVNGPQLAAGLDVARISGSFVGPVPYGAFLAVTALVLLFLPAGWLRRSVRLPAVLVGCAALVGSSSREGWVIFTAGVLALGWRARPRLVAVAHDFHGLDLLGRLRELDPGLPVVPYLSTGATDSAPLRARGVQAYGVLPFPLERGDEERMHGHDERVPLESLHFGVKLVYGAIRRVAT
jgi:hypothetical protein